MMRKNVVITGSTGIVGKTVTNLLTQRGHRVVPLSRRGGRPHPVAPGLDLVALGDTTSITDALGGLAEPVTIVHLSGARVADERWTEKRKAELEDSRCALLLDLTTRLRAAGATVDAIVGASALGIYQTVDRDVDNAVETDVVLGEGGESGGRLAPHSWSSCPLPFQAYLARRMEEAQLDAAAAAAARLVTFRFGLVAAPDAIAWQGLTLPAKWGLGANLGSGSQWLPLIHRDDLAAMIACAVERVDLAGTFNAAAPSQLRSTHFTTAVSEYAGVPFWLPSLPASLLSLLLGPRWSLLKTGVQLNMDKWLSKTSQDFFKFPSAQDIIKELC